MRRVILLETHHIPPFNEAARDLRVQNKPLWLWQKDVLAPYVNEEREYPNWQLALKLEGKERLEMLVHRDNLFFNARLIEEFISRARAGRKPVRLAFRQDDPAVAEHVLPLSRSFVERNDLILADMWYLPTGIAESVAATPLIIDMESRERGYYYLPPYISDEFGDLVYHLPRKAFAAIDSWVHIFIIDILFGVFARGAEQEDHINRDWRLKLKMMFHAVIEQRRTLESATLVKVGKNVNIDPSAVIHGPTTIGDNVQIGAGAVIDNCIIGNNATVSQGCNLMLSVVGDGCFLPFRASLFMTTLMENTSVSQNTCLQLSVVGRDSFIGAGTTFTDFSVLPQKISVMEDGERRDTGRLILGGCVGHHCRLTSGLIIYPARTIESDVVIIASDKRQYITRNVSYEDSDHHAFGRRLPYPRLYPRQESADHDPG